LLCTKHWSQSMNNHFLTQNRTWQASYSNHIILYWDQCWFKRTVPWDASTNTGYLPSATGAIDYWVYSASIDADNNIEWHEHVCFNSHADGTHLVSNDKQDEDSTIANANDNQVTDDFTYSDTRRRILQISSQRNCQHNQQTLSRTKMNLFLLRVHKQAKLLCWHYQLGHLPFACLWILTLIKTIPKWLLKVKAPKMCWLYVQSNDQATWRMKGSQNKNKIQVAANLSQWLHLTPLTNWNLQHQDS
jgi:hypothetical protein